MELVSRVYLSINGQEIDFDSVEEKEYDVAKAHNLCNTTGHFDVTSRYGATCTCPIPKDTEEYDFASVRGGTLTIDQQNGRRITYTGVRTVKMGGVKYDGDNAATRTVEFSAENRLEE
jgi:hypothetical protein